MLLDPGHNLHLNQAAAGLSTIPILAPSPGIVDWIQLQCLPGDTMAPTVALATYLVVRGAGGRASPRCRTNYKLVVPFPDAAVDFCFSTVSFLSNGLSWLCSTMVTTRRSHQIKRLKNGRRLRSGKVVASLSEHRQPRRATVSARSRRPRPGGKIWLFGGSVTNP
jgi:hypothetical protein